MPKIDIRTDTPPKKDVPVNRHSKLATWLKSRPRPGKRISLKESTHLLLSGGVIQLCRDEEEQMIQYLADDLETGDQNYVIERRTPVFAFHQDFDIEHTEEISLNEFNEMLDTTLEIMKILFPDGYGRVVVSRAPCKFVHEGEARRVKSGYHVVYPDLLVNAESAVLVRHCLLQIFTSQSPLRYSNTWADILDESVYLANGLRMNGSHKACKCSHKNTPCLRCRGTNYLDQGRPYRVVQVDRKEKSLKPLEEMQLTSMRRHTLESVQPVRPDWFQTTKAFERSTLKASGKKVSRKRGRENSHVSEARAGERVDISGGNGECSAYAVTAATDKCAALFTEIAADVIYSPKGAVEFVKIARTNVKPKLQIWGTTRDRYCPNKRGEHSRQGTYVYYAAGTIRRLCWSDKNSKDRLHGPCTGDEAKKFFWEQRYKVPDHVHKKFLEYAREKPVGSS